MRYVRPYRASTDAGPVVVVANSWSEALCALWDTGHCVDGPEGSYTLRGVPTGRWTSVTATTDHLRHVALRAC